MSNKIKLTIATTGLNAHDNPGPGIPVIRSLKESTIFDIRIIGFAYENLEPGIYMNNLVDKTYLVPYPQNGKDALFERITEIHAKEPLDIIIPNYDSELFNYMKLAPQLNEMGIKTFLPTMEQFEERHKHNLDKYGQKYGLKIPESKTITSVSDINKKLEEQFDYPIVVKGKFYDAYIAYDKEQAISHFNKVAVKWGLPIIIQQFIAGTEVNVAALGDGKGNTIGAVPMKKLYITDKGKGWAGITLSDEKMLELTQTIMQKTKWTGGMELELIRDNKNDLYIVEINPRIPAWIYLATAAGQNMPEALVKLALGMEVAPFDSYEVGKMFIRYSFDLITTISELQQLAVMGEK